MINNKCHNMHKYGPFEKNNNNYYRKCLRCNKKNYYPLNDEIKNEYNNQRIINYIIEIIIKKDLNRIQNNNYYFRLIICLLNNISYIYLSEINQNKLLQSLKELNIYFNKNNKDRYKLIDKTINYHKKYFIIYNNEINSIYNEKELEKLDNNFININEKIDIELEKIIFNEENSIISIKNSINQKNNNIEFNLNEIESETD